MSGTEQVSNIAKIWDKATTENVVALIVAIAVTAAAVYYAKWEILSVEIGSVMGYLYGKKKENEA